MRSLDTSQPKPADAPQPPFAPACSTAGADAPFRATHSWLVGDAGSWPPIALVAAAGFVLAGVGFITQQAWWAFTGIGAGAVALLLMTLFFNPWLLAGIAISAGILYAGLQALRRPSWRRSG